MYEENRNQEFDGNGNPDNHRSEEQKPNFVMRDTGEPSEPESLGQARPVSETIDTNRSENETFSQTQPQARPGSFSQGGQQTVELNGQNQNQNQNQYRQPESGSQGTSGMNGGYYGQPRITGSQMGGQPDGQPAGWTAGRTGSQPGGGYQNPPVYGQMYGGQNQSQQSWQTSQKSAGKGRKRRGLVSKAAGITAAALLFGVVSGGTMVGVNMLADSMKEETYPQVSQATVLEESETPVQEAPANSGPSTQPGNALAMDVSAIVENSMPSIVAINNTMLYESNSWFGGRQTYEVPSSGSGIIVGQNDEELLVVTNNHVVENASTLSVVFIDSTSVTAAVKGTDAETDLAVIAVPLQDIPADTLGQISVAKLGNSDALKVGQSVIAIGNALGYGQSVTVGWVSALDREVTTEGGTTRNLLQTDAAINPGNSGGALLNMRGEVIGINAAKYSSTDVEGIGYAIPISKAEDIINSLMTKRTRSSVVEEGKEGYLGIQGFTVDDSMIRQLGMPSGVFVSGIIEGGAASKTEMREKDIITKFDDQTVRTMAALQDMLKYYKEGETVSMTVQSLENGEYVERVFEITLGGKSTLGEDDQSSQSSPQRNR